MRRLIKQVVCTMLCFMYVVWNTVLVYAQEGNLAEGTYQVNASLSCYINAMGGVEFGDGLFKGAYITIDSNGNAMATLELTAGKVTIYSVTCDTFVDATNSVPGYYDSDGMVFDAKYTKSSNTALNAANEEIHYVDSMTFPVSQDKDTYYLWIYVNSNVMGSQFCDGKGSGGSGKPGEQTPYAAIFTIDWSSLPVEDGTDETKESIESIPAQNTDTDKVENMEGLSIYRADENRLTDDTEKISSTENVVQSMNQWQYTNPMIFYACIAIGTALIFLGGMLLLSGNKVKEHRIVIRLEMGDGKRDDSEK